MKHGTVGFGAGFAVVLGNQRAQAARMVIRPGQSEGGPTNRHRNSDQWLFVLSGTGVAVMGRKRVPLRRHTLLLIEHGERHEIRNSGRTLLKTLNFYSPPGYTRAGNELPAALP